MRALLGRFVAGTAARKRALLLLACLPLAAAFIAGVLLGVGAQAGGWGTVAILASIPLAVAAAFAVGRLLFGAAQSIRRVQGAFWLVDKLEPLNLAVADRAPVRVNIVHPAIDLKHFFGGFIAVFNLAKRLAERGHSVRLVATEGPELPRDWRRQLAGYEGIGSWIDDLEVAFAADRSRPLEISPEDALIATHWTAAHVAAAALPAAAGRALPLPDPGVRAVHLPDGQRRGALPAKLRAAAHGDVLDRPAAGLVRQPPGRRLRAGDRGGRAPPRSASTTRSPRWARSPKRRCAAREPRRLLFYARPEEHAARNLYEIGAMALDRDPGRGSLRGLGAGRHRHGAAAEAS